MDIIGSKTGWGERMVLKKIVWVGSIALFFFFVPSLALKIWDFIVFAPWQVKSWLFYLIIAVVMINFIRWRLRHKNIPSVTEPESTWHEGEKPLLIAKERLAKGEISLEEFREIRRKLKEA